MANRDDLVAGYAAYQCLVPLTFVYDGPAAAGRLGLSLALATAPYVVGLAWLQARTPSFALHIGRGDRIAFEELALNTAVTATLVCLALSLVVIAAAAVLLRFRPQTHLLMLPPVTLAILCTAGLANVVTQAIGTYLRAHRTEQYLALAVFSAGATVGVCWLAAQFRGTEGVALGYAVVASFLTLPLALRLLIRHRKLMRART